ncbi:RanBP1 domain protein [Aspergillus clavatus NRRL 1]|uniref:RNase3 domain protein n=1 Tax=Aspergillus clavatus (strain ATCC 1007 / CBS 513.65 / DSM 816 / NCTC 3887 / NRRL 1 / QM 1276 / 107) TaxID=344612 RepID=A1CUG5_ASPCL|nr:RNase3 domain protein [Aspergillus clavatus NRRL 1]EAW06952.1 RNase3 domain protein [Aspergillus clavatus NRRL 1]
MSSTPEEKPQRATAAQLANRKIKDIRRRPRPSTTASPSTTTGAPSFSPFNSIDPNTVSSSQPASNGFSFGQSQSFPGATSSTTQPAQNGGSPFAFGAGAGSSSFSFNSSFGGSGSSPNPFASINTTAGSQQSDTSSASGFKGNMFNLAPSGSSALGQQALPTGGLFGTPSQQNTASGGLFGSCTTTGTSSQPVTAPATTGSIFGQTNTTSAAPSPSIFSQSTSDKPSPFGQSTVFGSDSMQTSPDPKANAAAAKPSVFGSSSASQSGFGASTGFTGAAAGSVFGGATPAAQQTPSKPLFGAKPAEQGAPSSTSFFGATSQPTTAASATTPASTGATATTTTSTSLFGTASPAKPATPFQNPFQSSNLFSGVPAASASSEAAKEKEQENKAGEASKTGFQFSTPTSSAGNLFSKSANAAAPPSTSTGLFQAPSTGSLFAPKPASAEADQTKAAQANPFSSLLAPKPDTAKPTTQQQKPLPSPAPFSGLFAPKPSAPAEGAKAVQQEKPTTPTPVFSTPSSPKSFAPQSSVTLATTTESKTQAPVFSPSASQTIFKANGTASVSPAPAPAAVKAPEVQCAEKFLPRNLPSGLGDQQKKDVELVYRLRLLNESFQREIAKLNPATDDFDAHVLFYMRVREVIGAPTGPYTSKRKASELDVAEDETQSVKKVKPFGANGAGLAAGTDGLPSATKMSIAPSSITSTPSKLFDGKQNGAIVNGNHPEETTGSTIATSQAEGRSSRDSTTASIFAQSFSKSRTDEADHPVSFTGSPRPSTPETNKPALFSTTPTTSPAKSLFSTPATTQENATSSSLFSQSTSKPTFTAPTTSASAEPKNPFVLKPIGAKDAETSPSAALAVPKFGTGTGTATNFFAQFKSIADKDAEKEKEKRKAEDFDSEEEDEAEWERKDAEQQRKKREELESQSKKRPRFVPGKGFVFEDESSDAVEPEKPAETATSGASVFDQKRDTPAKSNNIFGHLSATPSEAEEDNDADDTEEASAAGEEPDDEPKELSLVPGSEDEESRDLETSEADSKAVSVSGAEFSANDSSDDGDLSKALKKSKQAATSSTVGGRSLFDRVQYDPEGKPKRQNEEAAKNPFSSLSSSLSKTPSTSTTNPFGATSTSVSGQTPAIGSTPVSSVFGSVNNSSGLFTSTPAGAASATPSIFGQNTSKAIGDKTWKPDSPIKFADSTATTPSSSPKPVSDGAVTSADASKPFSTLFGAPAAGTKSSGSGQPSFGFSFGAPGQQSSSFLAPSTIASTNGSRASTPGVASDTPAEETGDGDTAENLPQVDLARSRVGEEDEDIVLELRGRALQALPGDGWVSKGVGYLRILKNRNTSRARILLRADPSGKIVLNAALMKNIKYTAMQNSIHFLVPKAEGAPEQWAIRVKPGEIKSLETAIEQSKS